MTDEQAHEQAYEEHLDTKLMHLRDKYGPGDELVGMIQHCVESIRALQRVVRAHEQEIANLQNTVLGHMTWHKAQDK